MIEIRIDGEMATHSLFWAHSIKRFVRIPYEPICADQRGLFIQLLNHRSCMRVLGGTRQTAEGHCLRWAV
jgi:hypothetical protein